MAALRRRAGGPRGTRRTGGRKGTQRTPARDQGGAADLRAALQQHAAEWERWGHRVRKIVNRVVKTCGPSVMVMDTITNPPKPPFGPKRWKP